jgi:hypothetical protein
MESSSHITVEIPASLADDDAPARARQLLLLDAVRSERLSWRQAASELGLSLADFLHLASEHRVPVTRYEIEDWRAERATLDRLGLGRHRPA